MVATFITLCNSACITCIWCFLFSICFPNFVRIMKETESSEYNPQKVNDQRESFESVGAHDMKRRNGLRREFEFDNRRDTRREDENSQRERRDIINVCNRTSENVSDIHPGQSSLYDWPRNPDYMDLDDIHNHDNKIDFQRQKIFASRLDRSHRRNNTDSNRNKYRDYGKLNGVASDTKERFDERKKQRAKELYSNRTATCHGCGNH